MKVNTNKKNKSASRKLVPAVAMLTTSAVMLSSATYAWFTLNKEVEVTGLSMSATASDALEISLGARGTTAGSTAISGEGLVPITPGDKDVSWTNNEVISSYYKEVGKLKPASSADAVNLYYATDVTAGGRYAGNFAALPADGMAALNLNASKTYIKGNNTAIATLDDTSSDTNSGYYIDIPVWLRTTKMKDTEDSDNFADIYCAVKIARKTSAAENASVDGELYKAVRVAFLPTTLTAGAAMGSPSKDNANTVYGVSNNTYDAGTSTEGVANGRVVKGEGARSDTTLATPNPAVVTTKASGDTYLTSALNATIPYATADSYGRQQFIVRIWLEGEDVNCWDLTSNQDWSIDFAFSLSAFAGDNQPTFKTVNANPGP